MKITNTVKLVVSLLTNGGKVQGDGMLNAQKVAFFDTHQETSDDFD